MSNAYIVKSGNWMARVVVEGEAPYSYVEAATRAMEGVFGNRPLTENCELVNLYDKNGKDYFDPDSGMSDTPPRMFSVVTVVRKEHDDANTNSYYAFLSSVLFANASQPQNYTLAMQAEALEPENVKRFKEMCNKSSVAPQAEIKPVKPKKKKKKG
jgi:hypothetical protein